MSTINFSYDPEWLDTLSAPFMTNAFIAGLCIALAAGVMGYFTIARRSTFAAHALAHIGLPGATGAVLLGLPVSLGMGVFALGGALVIGALGKRVSEREIATGTVLAFATGLGLFFARLSSSASQQMQSILFGSILTITTGQIIGFAVFDVLLLALLAIIYRPLLFSSLDEQVAQAKGVPIGLMNVAFMAIMAGVITIAVPAVGTLLIFALVITPAATANILAGSPFKAMVIASVLCLVSIWAGLVLSAMFPELHHRDAFHPVLGYRQSRGDDAEVISFIFLAPAGEFIAGALLYLLHQGIGDGGDAFAAASESHMVGGGGSNRYRATNRRRQGGFGFSTACADFRAVADDRHRGRCRRIPVGCQMRHNFLQHIDAMHSGTMRVRTDTEQ